jgi:hypothetical protein
MNHLEKAVLIRLVLKKDISLCIEGHQFAWCQVLEYTYPAWIEPFRPEDDDPRSHFQDDAKTDRQ